jgi:PKD repeat protein
VVFANPTALSTTVSFSAAGTYTLSLTASNGSQSSVDTVQIKVLP